MDHFRSLPFRVGHRVETKSFITGYRGAWFRCEIKETTRRGVALEYYDFPDQRIIWMKSLYHKPPGKSIATKAELMLRPQFPPVYHEGEAPDVNTLSEVIVVTNGVWKVGDLVDWFCDGAYWSATITEVRGDGKVQVQLPPRPVGEGMEDEAFCKDLRPSLEWSQTSGWKLPVPKGNDSFCPCARLIEPVNQGKLVNEGKKDSETVAAKESPSELNACASRSSAHSLPSSHGEKAAVAPQKERRAGQGEKKVVDAEVSCSDSVSSSTNRRVSAEEVAGQTLCKEDTPENDEATKRIKLNKHIPLNSSTCDSTESLIADMEELINRVKWMKQILGPPESDQAVWKFQEYPVGGKKVGLEQFGTNS